MSDDDGEAAPLQKVGEHGLSGDELREDQNLQDRVVFLALLLLDAFEQRFGLHVRTAGLASPGGREQQLDLLSLVLQALQPRLQNGVELLLAIQRRPVLGHVFGEQRKLALGQLKHRKPSLQGGPDRRRA